MEKYRKVFPGDDFQIPAAAYNDMLDAAIANRNNKNIAVKKTKPVEPPYVLVKNDTGVDIESYRVLGISGQSEIDLEGSSDDDIDKFTSNIFVFRGVPVGGEASGSEGDGNSITRYAITQEAIPDGEIGRCLMSGTSYVFVKRDTENEDLNLLYADIVRDHDYMRPCGYGSAQILWEDQDESMKSAEHLAYILLSSSPVRLVKATADASSDTIAVKYVDSLGDEEGEEFTVWTW